MIKVFIEKVNEGLITMKLRGSKKQQVVELLAQAN